MNIMKKYVRAMAGLISALVIFSGFTANAFPQNTNISEIYQYQDTIQLVELVNDAAALYGKVGNATFHDFGTKGSKWFNNKHYIFIYDLAGNCVFHPEEPELVGQNLINLKDIDGKPVIRMITDVGKKPDENASGWVFYLWEDGTQLSPLWKGSYIRKVIGPDKKTYVIGSGLYSLKIEKKFIKDRVILATDTLLAKGKDAAFKDFRDPASPFFFLGAYIFVLQMNGFSLFDPAYPTSTGRNLLQLRDSVGMYIVQEMIKKLQNNDEAWIQYMWPKPGEGIPSRKLVYIRKVKIKDEFLIVGSEFFLPTPIWMRI